MELYTDIFLVRVLDSIKIDEHLFNLINLKDDVDALQ